MKLKILLISTILFMFSISAFAQPRFEAGIGSGFVFYGSDEIRERNDSLGDSSQIILCTDAKALLPLEQHIYLSLGADLTMDARWNGSNHIFMWDYSGLLGFKIFTGLAGLVFSVDYALGRRTDFIEFDNHDSYSKSTDWGNGFKFQAEYDFSVHTRGFAPSLGIAWKNMPRGNYRDNLLAIAIRFGI